MGRNVYNCGNEVLEYSMLFFVYTLYGTKNGLNNPLEDNYKESPKTTK